ncbi:MAG: rhamnulokinase, partial [Fibrobacteres bacterium]|nr:rhamnulokinase [Fibrobacterota bacterium]
MIPAYIAVDLGASSGRVILGTFRDNGPDFEITGRFTNAFRRLNGHDRWDFEALYSGIAAGIKKAAQIAETKGYEIRSIGCDTWGVDYGLIGEDGELIEDPIAYRDSRTDGVPEKIFKRVDKKALYSITGIQQLVFNTINQLYAHFHSQEWPTGKVSLLMMPDLIHYRLCGVKSGEYSNASTSQLVNASTGEWDSNLFSNLGLPIDVMPVIRKPGTVIGTVNIETMERTGIKENVKIVLPATHDTGSAIAGTPLNEGWAYLSSGTWSLLGLELNKPCLTEKAALADFTNEGGVAGTIRFLRNVMGLWLLESCRREWQNEKILLPYDDLLVRMESMGTVEGIIDPDDPVFLNPPSMRSAIAGYLAGKGYKPVTEQAALSRLILQSLASKYADVVISLQEITGTKIKGIHIVGGGSQNRLLNKLTAEATGLTIEAGPVEATAIGNLSVQAISDGFFKDISESRNYLRKHLKSET